jgi:hypothetical protein
MKVIPFGRSQTSESRSPRQPDKLNPETLRHLKEAFEESDLPFRVDVLDWHETSPEFQKVIEKAYEAIEAGN